VAEPVVGSVLGVVVLGERLETENREISEPDVQLGPAEDDHAFGGPIPMSRFVRAPGISPAAVARLVPTS
jgi:hypothetical protein